MAWHSLLDYTPGKKGKVVSNMEFLKSLIPAAISGEGPLEHGPAVPRDTGQRLLRMKRLGLMAMGQTIEEDPLDLIIKVDPVVGSSRPASSNKTRLKGMVAVVIWTDFNSSLQINLANFLKTAHNYFKFSIILKV